VQSVRITTKGCEIEPRSWRGVLHTKLCDKVCQWLARGRWFSPVSSTNKTDRHDITEILLTVALNIIKSNQSQLDKYNLLISSVLCREKSNRHGPRCSHLIGNWIKPSIICSFDYFFVFAYVTLQYKYNICTFTLFGNIQFIFTVVSKLGH
jgi:hypothetical protein